MFKVGQKVVYVTGDNMPKGTVCTIYDISKKSCGCYIVGINGISCVDGILNTPSYCPRCHSNGNCVYKNGWNPNSFVPLDETFAESVLENIKEQIKEEETVLI